MTRSLSKLFTQATVALVAPAAIALLAPACSSDEAAPGSTTDGGTGGASDNTGGTKSTGGAKSTGGSKATGGQAGSNGGSAGAGGSTGGSAGAGGATGGAAGAGGATGGSPGTGGTDGGNGGTPAAGGTDAGSGGSSGSGGAATGGSGNGGTGGDGGGPDTCLPLSLTPPTVTAPIQVPAGATVVKHFHAEGTQNYTCKGTALPDAGTSYSWGASVPEANLFQGTCQVGTHFAGPTWEFTADTSTVKGSKVAAEAHSGTIPWLLLKAVDHTGTGVFSNVTFVQRVDTSGGVAPSDPCDAGHVDVTIKVPYTAEYYFFEGGVGDGGP